MKTLKACALFLLLITIISCSDETDEKLDISDLKVFISEITRTTVKIGYRGNFNATEVQVLYKERNSTNDFQSINPPSNDSFYHYDDTIILQDLNPATSYEIRIKIINKKSSLQSTSRLFNTKAIDIDYDTFFSNSASGGLHYSFYETFSHLNKKYVLHVQGLSDFDDAKVYLVNLQKTDSLEIPAEITSETLTFTIPDDYLKQNPREIVKKAYLGIKIKESYEYLLNYNAYYSLLLSSNHKNEEENSLKLRIYNDRPYITNIDLTSSYRSSCSDYTIINFTGKFMGYSIDDFYWTATEAVVFVYDSNNMLYGSYSNLEKDNSTCYKFGFGISNSWEDGYLVYHQRKFAKLDFMADFPAGNYSTKIVLTRENGETLETNTVHFTKE